MDATQIATGYLSGKLTQDKANEKWVEYLSRWGEPPFEGSPSLDKMSGSQVVKLAEKIRRERERSMGLP